MSLTTMIIVLGMILIGLRCHTSNCNLADIPSEMITVSGKLIVFLTDVASYSVRKFYETDWFSEPN